MKRLFCAIAILGLLMTMYNSTSAWQTPGVYTINSGHPNDCVGESSWCMKSEDPSIPGMQVGDRVLINHPNKPGIHIILAITTTVGDANSPYMGQPIL